MLALLSSLLIASTAAWAQPDPSPEQGGESPWRLKARLNWMRPSNVNNPDRAMTRFAINDRTYPQLGVVRQLTPHLGTELVISYPQDHDMRLRGQKIGTFRLTPITFLVHYGFLPDSIINPYVGVGVNYSHFSSFNLPDSVHMSKHSTGLTTHLGVDYRLSRQLSVSVGWRRVKLDTDIEVAGNNLAHLRIDPDLFSVGMGYRF